MKTKDKFFENAWVGSKIIPVSIPGALFSRTFSGEIAPRELAHRWLNLVQRPREC
jgi:hypothetical protein